jgi:signal transduction histidine kinase
MDTRKMEQAVLNIFRNAMESISGEGTITVSATRINTKKIGLQIRDTGAGILPETVDRIFDPFFTTKEHGVGMGLCIAHEIIVAHGGEIRIQSEPDEGTTFEILLDEVTGRGDQ